MQANNVAYVCFWWPNSCAFGAPNSESLDETHLIADLCVGIPNSCSVTSAIAASDHYSECDAYVYCGQSDT